MWRIVAREKRQAAIIRIIIRVSDQLMHPEAPSQQNGGGEALFQRFRAGIDKGILEVEVAKEEEMVRA